MCQYNPMTMNWLTCDPAGRAFSTFASAPLVRTSEMAVYNFLVIRLRSVVRLCVRLMSVLKNKLMSSWSFLLRRSFKAGGGGCHSSCIMAAFGTARMENAEQL